MTTVTVRRTAQATPGRVWSVATDIERWPETISGIDKVEVVDGTGFDVGTRWRETRTMLGREATEEMWVTSLEVGRSYTVEADSHGTHYISVFSFRPLDGDATEIEMSFTGKPAGTAGKVLGIVTWPFARKSVANVLRRDLDDIAAAAEAAS